MTSKVTVYTRKMSGEIYTLLSVNALFPIYSNVIGIYDSKKKAVENLIKRAGYMVDSVGHLYHHSNPPDDDAWLKYEELYDYVYKNQRLTLRRNDKLEHVYVLTGFSGVE